MATLVEDLDALLGSLVAGWNVYSTVLSGAVVAFVVYAVLNTREPDTHPMILLRQATAGMVRQPRESAVYRSHDAPHGYPLKTGLAVKVPGSPPYTAGKDGDLRDIWRRVLGLLPREQAGTSTSMGKIFTVLGREKTVDHPPDQITKEINSIGQSIRSHGGKRVAVYMPNRIELLASLFAGAFYGLDVVVLPYNQPHDVVVEQLNLIGADTLIGEAGALPLTHTVSTPKLKQVIWVVEETSRHMDWTDIPSDVGGKTDVSVWHELVSDHPSPLGSSLPDDLPGTDLGTVGFIWQQNPNTVGALTEFTHSQLVAAVAAQLSALPKQHHLSPADLFYPADSLDNSYTLVLTLAALFSHASLAINSVANPDVNLHISTSSVAPTVIVASAKSLSNLHAEGMAAVQGSALKRLAHSSQASALAAGRLPQPTLMSNILPPERSSLGNSPGQLRLVYVAERVGSDATPPLSSEELTNLRILLHARVIYSLTAPQVAGAVCQTAFFDYRTEKQESEASKRHAHFGVPLSCVELKVVDTPEYRTTDDRAVGQIVASGPAVIGREAKLGVNGRFNDDGTLSYV